MRLGGERLGATARHEHAGLEEDAQAAELRPAEELLERFPVDATSDEALELVRGIRAALDGLREQQRLVLGEDAAGRAQARDERGVGQGVGWHPRIVCLARPRRAPAPRMP